VSFGNSRFDHIITVEDLNPAKCYYDPESFENRDQTALIAEFDT